MTSPSTLTTAQLLREQGIATVPIKAGDKTPLVPWKAYQQRLPDDAELANILLDQIRNVVIAHEQDVERHVLAVADELVLAAAVLEPALRHQVERVVGEASGLLDRKFQARRVVRRGLIHGGDPRVV